MAQEHPTQPHPPPTFFPPTFTPFNIPVPLDPSPSPTTTKTITIHGLTSPPPPNPTPKTPPLLLLHGFPQTHIIWRKITPQLCRHFQLVLMDLRGYGGSGKLPRGVQGREGEGKEDHRLMAKSTMAMDCLYVMAGLGFISSEDIGSPGTQQPPYPAPDSNPEKEPGTTTDHPKQTFSILAHDRGARLAHSLATHHPSHIHSLLLLDITPTLSMYQPHSLSTSHLFPRYYWHWYFLIQPSPLPETMTVNAPEMLVQKSVPDEMARGRIFGKQAEDVYVAQCRDWDTVHAMCEDYRAGGREDLWEQEGDGEAGRRLKCRVRVVWGREGVVERLFDARKEWGRVCEDGILDVEGSGWVAGGHYIPEERPEELLRHCLEFFGGGGGGGGDGV